MEEKDRHYPATVLHAVDAGRKIDAIKLLRAETGLGLKEAKREIDQLTIIRRPRSASMPEQGGAGTIVTILLIGGGVFAVYWFFLAN